MATDNTEWPSPDFPTSVKTLITRFYTLIETQSGDIGTQLATDIFTRDGIMQSGTQKFHGSEGTYIYSSTR
jgi:hypothetical protein